MKLGRKPARFTHASLIRSHILARHLLALGPAPAASPDWVSAVIKQSPGGWLMDGNDNYGDCVIADCAHQEMLRTANVGTIWISTDLQALALYAYFQGYLGDFTDLAAIEAYLANNDNGCDELTVIQYLTTAGWLGRKLDGSANLDPTQLVQLKWAVCIFGACRLGINLPNSAMDQFNAGQPWDSVAGASLAGGHDVPIVKYDADGTIWVVTWGKLQAVTPAFMAAHYSDGTPYVEEAHAELALDWVNATGTAPSKLNLTQLLADLTAVVDPTPPPLPTPVPPTPPSPPPVAMSKYEFFSLINSANHADFRNQSMSVEQVAMDISSICQQVVILGFPRR